MEKQDFACQSANSSYFAVLNTYDDHTVTTTSCSRSVKFHTRKFNEGTNKVSNLLSSFMLDFAFETLVGSSLEFALLLRLSFASVAPFLAVAIMIGLTKSSRSAPLNSSANHLSPSNHRLHSHSSNYYLSSSSCSNCSFQTNWSQYEDEPLDASSADELPEEMP
jgi:hypothetical protein